MGHEFQDLLIDAGIDSSPTTARNPQGNSITERVHQAVGTVIRTLVDLENPQTVHTARQVLNSACATAMHAVRCASSEALNSSNSTTHCGSTIASSERIENSARISSWTKSLEEICVIFV